LCFHSIAIIAGNHDMPSKVSQPTRHGGITQNLPVLDLKWLATSDSSGAVFAGTRTNNVHQGTLWYVGDQVVDIKVAAFAHSKQSGASTGICVITGEFA
jgi:hypothetical protein